MPAMLLEQPSGGPTSRAFVRCLPCFWSSQVVGLPRDGGLFWGAYEKRLYRACHAFGAAKLWAYPATAGCFGVLVRSVCTVPATLLEQPSGGPTHDNGLF